VYHDETVARVGLRCVEWSLTPTSAHAGRGGDDDRHVLSLHMPCCYGTQRGGREDAVSVHSSVQRSQSRASCGVCMYMHIPKTHRALGSARHLVNPNPNRALLPTLTLTLTLTLMTVRGRWRRGGLSQGPWKSRWRMPRWAVLGS